MSGIRRALLFSSGERYINLIVNFALIAVVSRLLTPEEIGITVIGVTIVSFVEIMRDVPSIYIVQHKELDRDDVRTSFTTMLIMSLILAVALFALSGSLAQFYNNDKLTSYLQIVALAVLPGPFERVTMALLRRDMAFQSIAAVNIGCCLVNAAVTVTLVLLGYSFLSFAYAMVAQNLTAVALANACRREFWIYRPRLTKWQPIVRFGGYTTGFGLVHTIYELLPNLLLSRLQHLGAVGLYSRIMLMSQLPDRLVLSGLAPVAFSALSAKARAGHDLKGPYLRALALIFVVQWPALVILAVLAHPAVEILLGRQWLSIVPLVQVCCVATLLTLPITLTYVTSAAMGVLKDLLKALAVSRSLSLIVVAIAAFIGLEALVWSLFITIPFNTFMLHRVIQRHLGVSLRDTAKATFRSAGVAGFTAIGPIAVVFLTGGSFAVSIPMAIVAGAIAGLGWLVGLWLTRHILLQEVLAGLENIRDSYADGRPRKGFVGLLSRLPPLKGGLGART